MNYPYLEESAIEGEAAALYAAVFGAGPRRAEPVDLDAVVYDHLSEREGLSFDDEAVLAPERGTAVLGKTLPVRGQILLNRALKLDPDPGRARFTLAHEIGHWVLHRRLVLARREVLDLFSGAAAGSREFAFVGLNTSVFPGSCKPGAVAREEWQANHFAAALLIHPVVLREEFRTRWGEPPAVRATQTWRYRARTVRELAQVLAKSPTSSRGPLRAVFGVSIEAMAVALESRGYVVERPSLV